MLSVLVVSIQASGGGAETALANLRALAGTGAAPLRIDAMSKHAIDAAAPLPKLRAYLRFLGAIRRDGRQYDFVVAGLEGLPFLLCKVALLGLRQPRLVMWLHCSPAGYLRYQGRQARLAIGASLRLAANIVCAAPAEAVRLAAAGKRTVYLPNLRAQLADALRCSVSRVLPRLVFIGSFAPLKQPGKCVELLAALRDADDDYRLDLFGSGPLAPQVAQQARAAGLEVALHGFVAQPWQAVEPGSILLLPSLTEAMPMVILEAIERGCVIIANTFDGHAFFDGHDGIFIGVDFADIDAVAAQVRRARRWDAGEVGARLARSRAFLRHEFDNDRSIAILAAYLGSFTPPSSHA